MDDQQYVFKAPGLEVGGLSYGEFLNLQDSFGDGSWKNEPLASPVVKRTLNAGRNEPCPCGSGAKFKRCCLRKPPAKPKGEA